MKKWHHLSKSKTKEQSEADVELESEYERMTEFNESGEDYEDDEETSM